MLRWLIFLAVIAALTFGLAWLADNPGVVTFTWRGVEYETSMIGRARRHFRARRRLAIVWSVLRFTCGCRR